MFVLAGTRTTNMQLSILNDVRLVTPKKLLILPLNTSMTFKLGAQVPSMTENELLQRWKGL